MLVTVSDKKKYNAGGWYEADVVSASDYTPFGMQMVGRNLSANGYRYGFNGKEKLAEYNSDNYDYGLRIYDSRVGRFLSTDPLGNKFPWNSAYAYAENDVIRSRDLEGGEKDVKTFSYSISNGQTVASVASNNYVQPEGTFHIGFKPQTTKEIIAKAFVESNKLPTGGTFSFFDFGPGVGKENYARYEYADVGRKQQLRYFDAQYIDWMYGQMGIAQDKLQKGLNVVAAGVNAVAAGGLLKAELKGLSAEIGAEAKVATGETSLNTNCFVAGTKVLTKSGLKAIEEIAVGDSVWAYNEATHEKALKNVISLSRNVAQQLVQLSFDSELVWTTPEHPFWINNTWMLAKDIHIGDSVTLFSKSKYAVTDRSLIDSTAKVYNFTVSEFHTYFVSSLRILVHNTCFEPVVGTGGKQFNKAIKEVSTGGGTPRLDSRGKIKIFEGRTGRNGKAWTGAEEYQVVVPGQTDQFRILKLKTGTDAAGAPIYKYGYSFDHYKTTIHEFKPIQQTPAQ